LFTLTLCAPMIRSATPNATTGIAPWEEEAVRYGQQKGLDYLHRLITEWIRSIDWPVAIDDPDGGPPFRIKEWRERQFNTLVGTLRIRLPSYWKKGTPSIRPAPAALGMTGPLSPGLLRHAISLGAELPFARAAAELDELAGCDLSHETIRVACEQAGDVALDAQLDPAVPAAFADPERISVQIDGGRVGTDDGWREPRLARIELENAAGRTHTLVLSRICSAAVFWSLLVPLLQRLGADSCGKVAFISDGAKWILDRASQHFPHADRILDFFHAAQTLHKAAAKIFGEHSAAGAAWARKYAKLLRRGRIDAVLGMLAHARGGLAAAHGRKAATAIDKLLGYLRPRRDQLLYMTFRHRGWPIGSGRIESLIKRAVNLRLKRNGAWWKTGNAERLLALRCAKLTGALPDVWSRLVSRQVSAIPPLAAPILASSQSPAA